MYFFLYIYPFDLSTCLLLFLVAFISLTTLKMLLIGLLGCCYFSYFSLIFLYLYYCHLSQNNSLKKVSIGCERAFFLQYNSLFCFCILFFLLFCSFFLNSVTTLFYEAFEQTECL